MTCDVPTLVDEARCYNCVVEQGMFLPATAYLLCKTAQGVKVNCDPETLANDSRCFACEIPDGYIASVILNVLCQLNQRTQGATCTVCHDYDPVDGVDIPPCDCAVWYAHKASGINEWVSDDGATWHIVGAYWP